MFKGIDTQYAYETCLQKGFCQDHSLELTQDGNTENNNEFLRKAMLFIRINVLDPVYFKKSPKCEKAKVILQRTSYFSGCKTDNIPVEAYDCILILDSVAVFTLCHLSKICCFGALFKFKSRLKSTDPEMKFLFNLLHKDRLQESDISHLNPLLQKNFIGCDINLIKVCYASTLLFVRNICIKQKIQSAVEEINKDILGDTGWEQYKIIADTSFKNKKYDHAINFYTTALTSNSFQTDVLADRAASYINKEKYKQAQMDSFIAVMIDPEFCKGYCQLSSSFYLQNMYKEALEAANYGLTLPTINEVMKEMLENIKIKSEIKLNIRKSEVCNIKSKISVIETKEESNNFPDLIEASDSDESDSEKLPELVDGSDSDEKEAVKRKESHSLLKTKKVVPSKKKRNLPQVLLDIKSEEEPLERHEIDAYLKEASQAILEDCGFKAIQIFRGPLRNFIEIPDSFPTFQECEIVCIKYAYGIAYCKSGEYDDLQKSISIFKEIIEKYESINFPAAYYALGLTYRKLNRFRDALYYLEKVNNILSKGIHFKVYCWPGMTVVIKETKSEALKIIVEDLIQECENPPNPDAVCRFAECEFQPAIYYTDPDFKGYISLSCSDQCCLQYHVQCWKILKSQKELNDKEFLEELCYTPDCDGIIIKIQHVDKKGDVNKEFVSDSKKMGKSRWAKWEKKSDVKEKKKKKTCSKNEEGSQENSVEDKNIRANSCSRRESESSVDYPVSISSQPEEKESEEKESEEKESEEKESEEKESVETLQNGSEGIQYEIISNSSVQSQPTSDSSIEKELPTDISKDICKTTQDIFSGSIKQNSFFSFSNAKFQEPDTSVTKEIETFDVDNDNKPSDFVTKSIKRNVYSYLADFLQLHGPLKIDDPILLNELSTFPEETLKTIKESGGIGEFLKNDLSFAYVGDRYVCVISDVSTAYRMHTNSSLPSDVKNLQSLENGNRFKLYNDNSRASSHTYTLNPDAREYMPFRPSDQSSKNIIYKHLIGNALYKNAMENPFANRGNKLAQPVNKTVIKHKPIEFSISKNFAQTTDSNQITSTKLSFSTPSLNTKTASNDSVNKTFQGTESQSASKINSAVNISNNFNNTSISISKCREIIRHFNTGNGEIKDIKEFGDTLLDLIRLYFKMSHHHQTINSRIKPYIIKKLAEMNNTATLTDKTEDFSIENASFDTDALMAENQHLLERNIKLENELCSTKKQEKDFTAEISNLEKSLNAALLELKDVKREFEQKEEESVNRRTALYDNLNDAYKTIDNQRKAAELFKAEKNSLQEQLDNLKLSVEEAEKCAKAEVETQVQNYSTTIQNLERENDELKNRAKNADLRILNLKKTEFLKKIDEKTSDAFKRRKEVTDGLSMVSSSLNPLFQVSITTLSTQLATYINELNTIKLNFVTKIDKQIDDIKSGSPLNSLEEIEIISLPEMPSIEKTLTAKAPAIDKTLLGGNHPSLTAYAPTNASAAISSGLSLSSATIPQVPSALPTSSFFPLSSPFSAAASLPLVATAAPNAGLSIPPETKKSEACATNDSVTLLDLNHLQKSLSSSTSSVNSSVSASLPSPECSLDDNVSHKNPQGFKYPSSLNTSNKIESANAPPGIQNSLLSDFSKAPGTNITAKKPQPKLGSSVFNLNGGLDAIPKVPEEERKKSTSKNSYEKLLNKLQEQFPGYNQEQLISFVKEFRMQRQGKLSGLPMDSIITEIGAIISAKKAEKKMPTKGLVNKKLVPDPKPKDPSPEPTTVKKKCAWGVATEKKWSGNASDEDCIICHEDLNSINSYKVPCGHIFHEKCIRQWLQLKSDCPVCRVLLLLPEDYPSLS